MPEYKRKSFKELSDLDKYYMHYFQLKLKMVALKEI